MKRVFYVFAVFIFISFMVIGSALNYLTRSSIHKATETKVKRDLEILATTTQGALAQNDYERVEQQVFLWGELEPHIVSFEVMLDGDIEIVKFAREIQISSILALTKTISLPSERIITFCIKYDLSENDKEAAIMTVILLSTSSCIAVVFIFLLWRILQRLAFIPLNHEITERKRIEEALFESESRFRDFFENAPIGFHIFDSNQTIKAINDSELEMIGYSRDEIIGQKTWVDLIVPAQIEQFKKHWHEITTTGKVSNLEYKLVHKQGHHIDVIFNASSRFDEDGKLINTRGSVIDITERKQNQKQIQDLARFPSENPSPVLRIAKDGTVLYSNKAGKLLLDTWGSDIGKKVPDKWQNLITKAFQFKEFEEVEEIVKNRFFSVIVAFVKDAGYANLYARDITERKRAEQEILADEQQLRASNQQLMAATETLRESEEKFRALVESSSDWIWETNAEGVYTYASPQIEEILGYKSEEIIGKSPFSLMPPEDVSKIVVFFKELQEAGKPIVALENISLHKDGRRIVLETSGIPIFDNAGNICGYRGVDRDITERKQAEEERSELARILEGSLNEIYIFDAETLKFLLVNKGARINLGYSMEELKELCPLDLKTRLTAELFEDLLKPLRTKEKKQIRSVAVHQRKDGSFYDVEIHIEMATFRFRPVFVAIILDITDRKRAEEQREELVKTLEYKNRELQDIVYTASHDLRSPLVNIEGFSGELGFNCDHLIELLMQQQEGNDKSEQIELLIKEDIPQCLRFISNGAKKMYSLLDGLLQVSRIGTVKIKSESLDVDRIVRETLDAMEHQKKVNNVTVTIDSLPRCIGDAHMMDHVFTNLISNAIKYRDLAKESKINISGKIDGAMSIYCVEDNGIGIAPDHYKKVFEIFHRLNPEDSVGGEGLGLTIVMRIMDRLDGKIWVESEPGKCSRFFIALPTV